LVRAAVTSLRRQEGPPARALEFLILTAARTDEVLGAKWDEIDLAERLWTVPAARMKAGKEHRVPLSDAALAVIEAMSAIRVDEYVFPGRSGALGPQVMWRILEGLRVDISVHGFRSTFRNWVSEASTHPREAAELALAHTTKGQTEGAYWRDDLLDKRRALMRDWPSAAPAARWWCRSGWRLDSARRPRSIIAAVSSPDLARSQAKVEDLPSDGGRVVDTIAGAMLRVFVRRLSEIEQAYGELRKRVGALEERPRPAPAANGRTTQDGHEDRRGSTAASRFAHRQATAGGNRAASPVARAPAGPAMSK
jgi:hypothetical protein